MNVKITVAYDGSLYQGSQRQPNGKSVEDCLVKAFKRINIEPKIILSGRTDKNVHATGQVFNIDIPPFWNNIKKLKTILNYQLPLSVQVRHVSLVEDSFHARFSARKRVYRYLITTKSVTPFNAKYITHVSKIDKELIQKAIKLFIGKHDFEYFHKKGSDKENLVREIFDANFYQYKDIYVFKFVANSYLRSQIRLMVGFLLAISEGKVTIEQLKQQLSKEKYIYKIPAEPYGLYLAKVIY